MTQLKYQDASGLNDLDYMQSLSLTADLPCKPRNPLGTEVCARMVMQRDPPRTLGPTDEYPMQLQTAPVIVATVSPAVKKFEDSKCEAYPISAYAQISASLQLHNQKQTTSSFTSIKGACHE